jgi:hypothetical protein
MNIDRRFLIWGLWYAALGMALGIYMAVSEKHGQLVTHAHILMLGFVLSFVYGLIHKLWLHEPGQRIANTQFVLHQLATITLVVGLFLIYGGFAPPEKIGPILGIGSVFVLVGMLLMLYMVIRFGTAGALAGRPATSQT